MNLTAFIAGTNMQKTLALISPVSINLAAKAMDE